MTNVQTSKRPNGVVRRFLSTFRRLDVSTFVAMALLALVGCRTVQNGPAPSDVPPYQELAAAHNSRVIQLRDLYAQGVIELRMGRRRALPDQGNMELWLKQPRHTALRVEKLGEILAWIGSDEQRYWFFDLAGEERVLRVGRHDQAATFADGAMPIQPLALLDLMGVTPLAPSDPAAIISFSSAHNAWAVETEGVGGPMRIYFDRSTRLPVRVETLTLDRQVALHSTLRRYESVRQEGMSPAAFPRLAQLIDIHGNPELAGTAQSGLADAHVKIAIASATGTVDQAQMERVFDLNRLIQGLRPARIEEPQHGDRPLAVGSRTQ
jgi:hypothetical protein